MYIPPKPSYAEAFKVVRSVTGYGTGNGPYVGFHDGFTGPDPYRGAFRNADRLVLDLHPYFAFGGGPNNDPIATGTGNGAGGPWPARACTGWDNLMGSAYVFPSLHDVLNEVVERFVLQKNQLWDYSCGRMEQWME